MTDENTRSKLNELVALGADRAAECSARMSNIAELLKEADVAEVRLEDVEAALEKTASVNIALSEIQEELEKAQQKICVVDFADMISRLTDIEIRIRELRNEGRELLLLQENAVGDEEKAKYADAIKANSASELSLCKMRGQIGRSLNIMLDGLSNRKETFRA